MKRLALFVSSVTAALALGSCESPVGLDVDIDVSNYKDAVVLRVMLGTAKGFARQDDNSVGPARITTEDTDGDKQLNLVTQFQGPFKSGKVSFRVTTGNKDLIGITGTALAFSSTAVIGSGTKDVALPGGGHGTLSIVVGPPTGQVIGPDTRSTDLGSVEADIAFKGTTISGPLSALAVCDLDGDMKQDLVLGAPSAEPNVNAGQTGGVYVVFGDGGATKTFEVGTAAKEFHFFGKFAGDKLGTAVACADLNDDKVADLIVGAPGADEGKGRVYVVFGRQGLPRLAIDLSKPTETAKQPDVQWTTAVATPKDIGLGSVLFAGDLDGDKKAEILASAPGARVVHLFTNVAPGTTPVVLDADLTDHVTFAGVSARALGAGSFDETAVTGPFNDIVLGDPEFQKAGSTAKSGVVYIFKDVAPGTPKAFTTGPTDLNPPSVTITGDRDMQFGKAVLALDTTGRGQDLLVGATNAGDKGEGQVLFFEHDSDFFSVTPRTFDDSDLKPLKGSVENGHFGSALAASPNGSGGAISWRLLVGAPDALRGTGTERQFAGAAYMFGPSADRAFPLLEQMFGASKEDRLGTAVAGGQLNGDGVADLVALAPGLPRPAPTATAAYVRFGR
jgi:hypothetical protein